MSSASSTGSKEQAGLGCALFLNESNDVVVKGLVHGGPCHLSCQVAIGDIVMSVDGTDVAGDYKLAKQLFIGEAETIATVGFKRNGAVKTVYLMRAKPVETRQNREGEVCGIGCTLAPAREGLAVSKIAPGSPAQLSGELQTLDVIVSVNGVDIAGRTPNDAAQLIAGPVGTRVTLAMIRGGRGARRTVELVRAVALDSAALPRAAAHRYRTVVLQQALFYPWLRRMTAPRKAARSVHGGQGTVSEVAFEGINSPIRIALKVVFQRGSAFKSAERSLWLNVDNHPHILPLLFTAGPNLLVMPYLELASVADWLRESPEARALPPEDTRTMHHAIGLQVAWALEHMHKVGTLHLDMKPNNVLVRLTGSGPLYRRVHCLVCDFGLAAVNIDGSATGRGGTPGFWAPELVPLDGAGAPVGYWTEPCADPPPPSRANITDKADTWMWATTMLGVTERLDRFRTQGYTAFTAALARGDGLDRLLGSCLRPAPQDRLAIATVALTMQRLVRDRGLEAFRPMDEDRSVLEFARAGHVLCTHLMGPDDPQTWAASERLVRVLRTHGEYAEAHAICARVLESKVAGRAEPPSIARTQRQLGGLLDDLGRYDAAVQSYRAALELQEAALGPRHVDVASTKDSLGVTLWRQGRLSEALGLYEEALEVREAVLGGEHVLVAKTIVNRANVYFKQGQCVRALADYSRALEIEKRTLGEEHVLVAKTKNNMGEALRVEGKLTDALQLYTESLSVLVKVLGSNHVLVANTKNNIAGIYLKQDKWEEALRCYSESLEIKLKVLGHDHVDVANTVENIGVIYAQQGRYDAAMERFKEALGVRTRALGDEHHDVGSTLYKMALVSEEMQDFAAAVGLCQQAVAKALKALGPGHPEVEKRRQVLARLQAHPAAANGAPAPSAAPAPPAATWQ